MFKPVNRSDDRSLNDQLFLDNIFGYIHEDEHPLTNLSNFAAIVTYFFEDLNWVGFYLYDGKKLYLGPFQGLPACTTIQLGKGVCGTAAMNQTTLIVGDTHLFEGHIVCDEASESEMVIPLIVKGELYGVLDLDAVRKYRFDETDRAVLEKAVGFLVDKL